MPKRPRSKKRQQKTGTNKKYKAKNKEEIKKHNRSPIPIPDPKKGALKDKAPKYRITGKQKDMLTGKDKRTKKVKKSKKVKESKKPSISPKLPCKPVLRFKPKRGAYILDADGSYIIGCSHTSAHTIMQTICLKINSGEITSSEQAKTTLDDYKQSGIDIA